MVEVTSAKEATFSEDSSKTVHDLRTKNVSSNTLAEQADATRHEIDCDKKKITEREKNRTSRLYLKSSEI